MRLGKPAYQVCVRLAKPAYQVCVRLAKPAHQVCVRLAKPGSLVSGVYSYSRRRHDFEFLNGQTDRAHDSWTDPKHTSYDVCFVRVLHCEPAVVFWCDPPRAREPDGRSTLWPSSPRPSLPCTAIRLYGYTALRSTALRLCGYTAAAVYLCTFVHLVNLILPEFLCFTFVPCAIVVVVPPPWRERAGRLSRLCFVVAPGCF